MENLATLSVLIVNWRSKDYLIHCLQSIRATCRNLVSQVVVVDGGSFDGCSEMLAALFPEVAFIQSADNIGFGRSNNLGFLSVSSEFLLLLNPDTELKPHSVQQLLAELLNHFDVGIVGPKLLNSDGSLQVTCVRALPTPINRALESDFLRNYFPNSRIWGTSAAFRSNIPLKVEAISGACMLMRSEVFRRVGGFSSEFFMYGEDMDLCAKVQKLGLKIHFVPTAEVLHHGSGSSKTQVSHFNTVMMRAAGETYMRLNHGSASAFYYRFLQALSALIRLSIALPVCVMFNGRRKAVAVASLKKWWYVLLWAIGASSLRK